MPENSWARIKPKLTFFVKAIVLITFFWEAPICAEEIEPPPEESTPTQEIATEPQEKLPEIEAKIYESQVVRKSHSGRIYLLNADQLPNEGRILLFKKNAGPAMAFRAIKRYPDKNQFAAKVVRKYPEYDTLKKEDRFLTIEKISDIIPPPPTESDLKDLEELESPEEPSSELQDEPTDKIKEKIQEIEKGNAEEDSENPLSEDEDKWLALSAEEVFPLDLTPFGVSLEFGYFRAVNPTLTSFYFSGGGVRFGLKLFQIIFLKRPFLQDSLTLEGGAFVVKIQNFGGTLNAYSLVPTIGDLRYTLHIGEGFNLFFYGGILKNFVVSSALGDPAVINSFSLLQPAFGGGVIFRVGPNWEVRVGVGYDMLGAGIVLRF